MIYLEDVGESLVTCPYCGTSKRLNSWCPKCERPKPVAVTFTPMWPCPSCPPGTEYYRDVSLPDGKFTDYRCAGCGYRYRAEKQ